MKTHTVSAHLVENAVLRLSSLAPLDQAAVAAIHAAARSPRRTPAHREVMAEGAAVIEPSIVLAGWAARVRNFADGRRQILSLVLPGDLIGICNQREPLAATTIVALTEVILCRAPAAADHPALGEAYAASGALENAYLFRQIARIGRFNAYERLIDWLLETRERLLMVGLATENSAPMPLTQECLADALGLTSVHVNRTLQMVRREGLLDLRGGTAKFHDAQRLAELVDYRPARISAALPVGGTGLKSANTKAG